MAKTKLFDSYTYKLTLPAPFDSPNCTGAKSFGFSRYNTVSVQKSTLHAPTLRALLAYAKLVHETDAGRSVQGLGAIGQQGTTYRIRGARAKASTCWVSSGMASTAGSPSWM